MSYMIEKIAENFKELSLAQKEGRYLADKSYAYDTVFFIAKFINRNSIGNVFNKREQKKRAVRYIEDLFNLSLGASGAQNYFFETLNLLEFAHIIKKVDKENYQIVRRDILEYICEYPENAYIFNYLLAYKTLENDGILPLFKKMYNEEDDNRKKEILKQIHKLYEEKSDSIEKVGSNWSKQLVKYSNIILGYLNNANFFSRTLNFKKEKVDIITLSVNKPGTRTPKGLEKKNDYIFKFSINYVKEELNKYALIKIKYDNSNALPEESIASELAELKLDVIDSEMNVNINNDFQKIQFVKEKMKTRNQAVQREFRKRLLEQNEDICPICGFSFSKFLIASHIKPYALCDNTYDAINQFNGLLLCPNHDKLFESAKYMTIDRYTGEIILNKEAKESKDYSELQGKHIDIRLIHCERTHYLRWHNEKFKENNPMEKLKI